MTDEELKQFKASLSITAVAQALGIDVVRGKFRCFCPQRHVHGDRTPSVSISEERGMFRCWVCDDVRGDVISLVQQYRGCSFLEALEWLKETYPFLVPGKGNRREAPPKAPSTTLMPIVNRPRPESKDAAFAGLFVDNIPEQKPVKEVVTEDERKKIILAFLKMLSPVDGTHAAA